jgi:hypothetical protein
MDIVDVVLIVVAIVVRNADDLIDQSTLILECVIVVELIRHNIQQRHRLPHHRALGF